jgi:hypothetical protein
LDVQRKLSRGAATAAAAAAATATAAAAGEGAHQQCVVALLDLLHLLHLNVRGRQQASTAAPGGGTRRQHITSHHIARSSRVVWFEQHPESPLPSLLHAILPPSTAARRLAGDIVHMQHSLCTTALLQHMTLQLDA